MDILGLIKTLLGIAIADTTQDTIINFYISKSQNTIKKYLNYDDLTGLDNQVTELALYYYQNKDNLGITQMTQGSRSQSMTDGMPQSIKDSLPIPKVRMC